MEAENREGTFKYICVEDKGDIDKFDFNGKTPECFELNYTLHGKEESYYIYIINK